MIKKIIFLLILFLISNTLIGCSSSRTENKELNLVISGLQQPSEKVFFKTFVKLFEAEYGISVNLTYVLPQDLIEQINSEAEAGNIVSDVIMVDTAHMTPYIDNNLMEDVSAYMDGLPGRTITEIFSDYTSRDDEDYFVPVSFDIYISIYNKLAIPYIPSTVLTTTSKEGEILQIDTITWEEFSKWAITIKNETGIPKTGFPMSSSSSQLLYPMGGMALAFGSESFLKVNDEGALEAWNLIAEMASKGAIVSESILSTVNQPTALIDTGTLWLSFGHMGPIGEAYEKNPDQYVLGPAPIAKDTDMAGSTAGAWTFGIVKGASHLSEAEMWLRFMTDPEINYLYCSNLGGVISPILEVVENLSSSNTDKIMASGLAGFSGETKIVVPNTSEYSSWNDVKLVYISLYHSLLLGNKISQEEADVYQSQIDILRSTTK